MGRKISAAQCVYVNEILKRHVALQFGVGIAQKCTQPRNRPKERPASRPPAGKVVDLCYFLFFAYFSNSNTPLGFIVPRLCMILL